MSTIGKLATFETCSEEKDKTRDGEVFTFRNFFNLSAGVERKGEIIDRAAEKGVAGLAYGIS